MIDIGAVQTVGALISSAIISFWSIGTGAVYMYNNTNARIMDEKEGKG